MNSMTLAAALKELKFQQASLSKLNSQIKESITIEKDVEEPKILFGDFLDNRHKLLRTIDTLKLAIIKANSNVMVTGRNREQSLQAWIIERSNIDELLGLFQGFLAARPGSETRGFGGTTIENIYAPGINYSELTKLHDTLRRERVEVDDLIQHTNYSVKIDVDI